MVTNAAQHETGDQNPGCRRQHGDSRVGAGSMDGGRRAGAAACGGGSLHDATFAKIHGIGGDYATDRNADRPYIQIWRQMSVNVLGIGFIIGGMALCAVGFIAPDVSQTPTGQTVAAALVVIGVILIGAGIVTIIKGD